MLESWDLLGEKIRKFVLEPWVLNIMWYILQHLQQKRSLSMSVETASPSRKMPKLGGASNDDKSSEND